MLHSLFKRSGIYFLGLSLGKILSLLVFILFARTLLPERFGDFVLFVTLIQIVTFFSDFGLNQWYQKQADSQDRTTLFSKMISARFVTLIVSLLISSIFLFFSSTFQFLTSIFFLLTLLPEAFLSVIDGYYLEKKQSLKVSLKVTSRMMILFFAYIFFRHTFNFETAVEWYFLSSVITLVWFFPWKQLKYFHLLPSLQYINILKSSSSYAFLVFSSFLYARGDSLVIRYVLNSSALGLYGAAYRYLESLSLLPTAISHNLFPLSAKKEGVSLDQFKKIVLVSILTGVIFSLIILIFSDVLIIELLGESYEQAIPILKIFSFVLFLFFLNAPFATVVQSSKLINRFLPYGFLNTLANIGLNLIFIPIYGISAAAWIMLITELSGLLINVYFIKKIYS
ncbi:oligosaccharide flippase family protein [Candidatus Roizmanbacteria bacterium]|nr:oligosaccharide flippase family protein [Candidatus Roizmanbacteria bacterium]